MKNFSQNKKVFFTAFLLVLAVLPLTAFAQLDPGLQDFLNRIGFVIGSVTAILSGLAFLYFVWGLVKFVMTPGATVTGDDKKGGKAEGKKAMVRGLIGMFVLVSIWGIIALLQNASGIDIFSGEQRAPCFGTESFFGPCY